MIDVKLYNPGSKVIVHSDYGISRDGKIIRYELESEYVND